MKRWSAVAIALASVAALYLTSREATPPPNAPPAQTVPTYDFEFDATTSAPQDLGPAPSVLSGRTRLKGVLSIEFAGSTRVLKLVRVDEIELKVGEQARADVSALRLALEGHRARWQLGEADRLTGVTVDEGAPPLYENLALTLSGELQAERRTEASWTTTERTARGVAEVEYRREASRILKTRRTYSELTGLGAARRVETLNAVSEFDFDEAGTLQTVLATEKLTARGAGETVARSEVTLRVRRRAEEVAREPAPRFAEASRMPGEAVQPADAARQHLEQRIDGLTPEDLLAGIDRLAALGDSPDRLRFAVRATGLLRAQPQLATALGERAAKATGSAERGFVLDLLVGGGTPEAQAALRAAVSSPAALADRERVTQFARLGLVEHPTPETVAFVEDAWQRADGKDRRDRALVVGALAASVQRDGDPARAEALGRQLAEALATAKDERDTLASLRALGNAGLDAQVSRVVRETSNPSPPVRAVAAFALRKTRTVEARRALSSLTEDPALEVQRSAFHGLGTLSEFEADALSARVTHINAATELVTALAPFVGRKSVAEALAVLAKRPGLEPQVRERIRTLLEEAPR